MATLQKGGDQGRAAANALWRQAKSAIVSAIGRCRVGRRAWSALDSGTSRRVAALIGHEAGGQPSPHVARWGCPCYADCDGSGSLTVADFGCFQAMFANGHPYADCNGAGGLTVADFGCFQTKFVSGCR